MGTGIRAWNIELLTEGVPEPENTAVRVALWQALHVEANPGAKEFPAWPLLTCFPRQFLYFTGVPWHVPCFQKESGSFHGDSINFIEKRSVVDHQMENA